MKRYWIYKISIRYYEKGIEEKRYFRNYGVKKNLVEELEDNKKNKFNII